MHHDPLSEARAGDGHAFGRLTEPYRRELRLHCYRMLGSLHDAEDALQETLLAAWQGLGGFEGRAALRTWLYQIATHRCLNVRRTARRRPAQAWNIPGVPLLEPTQLGEVPWLEPYPDELLDLAESTVPGPDTRYEQRESISLAFVTALQALPPRQVAVLVLRDVLGFAADEVAGIMETSLDAVNSALKRARAGLQRRGPVGTGREPSPRAGSPHERAVVERFVRAYEAADLEALVALFTDDVFVSMPPMPYEYVGRAAAERFIAGLFDAGRRFELRATRSNGQVAFGAYLRGADGTLQATGLLALHLEGDRISAIRRFERGVLPGFGLSC